MKAQLIKVLKNTRRVVFYRGLEIFSQHALTLNKKFGNNVYSFHVHNSQQGVYQTNIYLNDEHEVMHMDCSCPYGHGGYCKHEIAALLVLLNEFDPDLDILATAAAFNEWLDEAYPPQQSLMEYLFKEEAQIARDFDLGQFLDLFSKRQLLSEMKDFDQFSDLLRAFLYLRYRDVIKKAMMLITKKYHSCRKEVELCIKL